jgi:5-methylcytosine-specific restriction endonuclease McrA
MNERTLVLNSAYQVINVISWEDAISHLYEGDAETLHEWNDDNKFTTHAVQYDRSVQNFDGKYKYQIPAIIRMKHTKVFPKYKAVKFSKVNVLYRDDFTCQYCGFKGTQNSPDKAKRMTIDHVHPQDKGGATTFENCVAACGSCNSKKSNYLLKETEMRLTRKPSTPTVGALRAIKMSRRKIHDSWKKYLTDSPVMV